MYWKWGIIFSSPFDKQTKLGEFWANTFSFKNIDLVKAQLYLERFSTDFHFSECNFTTSSSIMHYIKYAKNSKTGPNGIPVGAYSAGGPIAAAVLANTLASIAFIINLVEILIQ